MAAAALVAPKCLVSQALAASPAPGAFVLDGVRFTRVWLQARAQQLLMRAPAPADVACVASQGVLVAATTDCAEVLLDDASGVLLLRLPAEARARLTADGASAVGRAVLVVGRLGAADAAPGARRALKVSKLVPLDGQPLREATWPAEVAELWRHTLKLLPPPQDAAPASA